MGDRGRAAFLGVRLLAGAVAVSRLARAATTAPPVRPTFTPHTTISVVVPARDEASRIGPLLDLLAGSSGVGEVIVVDDQSSDGTAAIAEQAGARVVVGRPLPDGWAGKAWALQQGIGAATGEWVVTLDADTRPDPTLPRSAVARAIADRLDLLTIAGRFDCPTPASRWLHASMLTTLVYRFGPPGAACDGGLANGQCMVVHRDRFLGFGAMEPVRGEVVEDVALARALRATGRRVGFYDGDGALTVRMFDTFRDTWRGWGRSLALPGVERPSRQIVDLAVVAVAQALPIPRLLTRRGDVGDLALAAIRIGTLVGTRRAYGRHGPAYWLSPLADPISVAALALGIARRGRQTWRGRTYGP
jgi:dolichol-phosphate mannosyltransferase